MLLAAESLDELDEGPLAHAARLTIASVAMDAAAVFRMDRFMVNPFADDEWGSGCRGHAMAMKIRMPIAVSQWVAVGNNRHIGAAKRHIVAEKDPPAESQ